MLHSDIPVMQYDDAIKHYGTDKPDLRFEMRFNDITSIVQGKGFKVFDDSEIILSINVEGCSNYTRKQIDEITDFVKTPQIGSKGLVYIKNNEDGTIKSSVDKFYSEDDLKMIIEENNSNPSDLILILAGDVKQTISAMSSLRLLMGDRLNLRDPEIFNPVWVINFPLVAWDEESKRYHAMHHPFTSPIKDDIDLLNSNPEKVRANAYDLVINGVEIGGGSIRIHDRKLQEKVFETLGFHRRCLQNLPKFLHSVATRIPPSPALK